MTQDRERNSEIEQLRRDMSELDVAAFDPERLEEMMNQRPSNRTRRIMVVVAVLAGVVLVAGAMIQGARPVDQSMATPSASVPAPSTTPDPTTPDPDPSSAPVESTSDEPVPGPTTDPSDRPSTDSTPAFPSTSVEPVTGQADVQGFYYAEGPVGAGLYFQTPTGNFRCAMTEDGAVGCQATIPVAGMEQCGDNPDHKSSMVSWQAGQTQPERGCTTQGIYVIGPSSPVLEYGTALEFAGNVCESRQAYLSCHPKGTNGGFLIAAEGIRTPADA